MGEFMILDNLLIFISIHYVSCSQLRFLGSTGKVLPMSPVYTVEQCLRPVGKRGTGQLQRAHGDVCETADPAHAINDLGKNFISFLGLAAAAENQQTDSTAVSGAASVRVRLRFPGSSDVRYNPNPGVQG
jgi:hypothetical protein